MSVTAPVPAVARHGAVLLAACLFPFAATAAPDAARMREVVDTAIKPVMARHKVPGMAVAVTVDGRAHFFNYGVASRETNKPVNEATIFELGSVSKTFTATLALYAQALGKLSLADHPGRYMVELKGKPIDEVTLLELGTYTAGGLPLQFPDGVSDDARMVRYFQSWNPEARPGTQRQYSNPSIGLLGHITGLALQRGFADSLEAELLPKLGLRRTHIRVPSSAMADYAWGYNTANKPVRVNPGVFDAETYGVKSTAADMIRFVQLNLDTSGLEPPVRSAVEATHGGHFEVGTMVQGLGWEQYPYPTSLASLLKGNSNTIIFDANPTKPVAGPLAGPRLFNKTGSTAGFGAYVAFVPAQRIGIVMLANRSYPITDRVRAAFTILSGLATPAK
ncbi:MAG: class C beta-lactamase [Burkholderiaceae bacterium]